MVEVNENGPYAEIVVRLTLNVPKSLIAGPIASDELQQYLNDKLHTDPDFYGEIDAGCIEILPQDVCHIRSTQYTDEDSGDPLYWSNDHGWTSFEEATAFTQEEANRFKNLPETGYWC